MKSAPERNRRRRRAERLFGMVCGLATIFAVLLLGVLIVGILRDGLGVLNWNFILSYASRIPERAGIQAALWGTVWLMGLTALFSIPVGMATAIYLEEYAAKNRLTHLIQVNISNLAGVPSIVYGILGLAIFARWLQLGGGLLAGALTMSLLILPVIIIASQEALRAVPVTLRRGSYALGATQWQTIRGQVLPAALPGMLTGVILALSRALGEAAPLLMLGALTFIRFLPQGVNDPFTTLPIQIFHWAGRPQEAFHHLAAGAIIVLLLFLLGMNAVAIYLRERYRIRYRD